MNIALIGYGKMGRLIEQIAIERGHKIVCIIDIDNREDFNSAAFASADVAIEFTTPEAAYGNIIEAMNHDVKVVTGSTGWIADHIDDIKLQCSRYEKTLFWSSNFSLGVYLFNKLNTWLAKLMNPQKDYAVRMEEVHHIHKLDAPSGTAITLAEGLIAAIDGKDTWAKGRFTAPDGTVSQPAEPVPTNAIAIDSVRQGEVPGIHSVIYDSNFDQITITHSAHNRRGFALGAVLAAEFTANHTGLLTMDDMFNHLTKA